MNREMKNAELKQAIINSGVAFNAHPVIIDIKDAKNGKKTVYCAAKVVLNDGNTPASLKSMNPFELAAQGLEANDMQRGMVTATTEIIAKNDWAIGKKLSVDTGSGVVEGRIQVFESREKQHPKQNPISFKNDAGLMEPKLKGGKKFYRTTKITTVGLDKHQLLSDLADVVE